MNNRMLGLFWQGRRLSAWGMAALGLFLCAADGAAPSVHSPPPALPAPLTFSPDRWVAPEAYKPPEDEALEAEKKAQAPEDLLPPGWGEMLAMPALPGRSAPADYEDDALPEADPHADISGKIRFANLPSARIKAIPDVRISGRILDRQRKDFPPETVTAQELAGATPGGRPSGPPYAKMTPVPAAPSRAGASDEACAALADMRRKQLEALEMDHQTLLALKRALADLNLTQRLQFMADGAVRLTEAEGAAAPSSSPAPDSATP